MALTWTKPLPNNGEASIDAGDAGHPAMHTQTVDCITEIRSNVDLVESELPTDSELMVGTAPAVTDSTGATDTALETAFNSLLADLRTRGVIS